MIAFRPFTPRRDRTAAMPFVMLTVLIDMMSIGLIIPVLPGLVGSFTGSPAAGWRQADAVPTTTVFPAGVTMVAVAARISSPSPA